MASSFLLIYPIYATLQSLRKPLKKELTHWLIFWFTWITLNIADVMLAWIPLSGFFATILIFGLYSERVSLWFRKIFVVPVYRDLRQFAFNYFESCTNSPSNPGETNNGYIPQMVAYLCDKVKHIQESNYIQNNRIFVMGNSLLNFLVPTIVTTVAQEERSQSED